MRPLPHIRVQLVIPNESGSQDYYTAIRDIRSLDNQALIKYAANSALLEVLRMADKKPNVVSMKVA